MSLWGIPILWWGRLGMILQFVGVIVAILDLLGPDRLRNLGRRLRLNPFSRFGEGAIERWPLTVALYTLTFPLAFAALLWIHNAFEAQIDVIESYVDLPVALSCLLLVLVGHIAYMASVNGSVPQQLLHWLSYSVRALAIAVIGVYACTFPAVAFLVLTLVISAAALSIWWMLMLALDLIVAQSFAWMLDRASPGHPIRWMAVLAVVVGFQFDLLAA